MLLLIQQDELGIIRNAIPRLFWMLLLFNLLSKTNKIIYNTRIDLSNPKFDLNMNIYRKCLLKLVIVVRL